MAYSANDVFPGPIPPRVTDIASIVAALAPLNDLPVVYSFGGGAPTSITIEGVDGARLIVDSKFAGTFSAKPGIDNWPGRMFIEFNPVSWMPQVNADNLPAWWVDP
jgi:hypothetical protein